MYNEAASNSAFHWHYNQPLIYTVTATMISSVVTTSLRIATSSPSVALIGKRQLSMAASQSASKLSNILEEYRAQKWVDLNAYNVYTPHQMIVSNIVIPSPLLPLQTATPKNFHVDSDRTSSRPQHPPVNTMLTPPSALMALRTSSRTLVRVIKCHEVKLTRFLVRSVYVRCTPRLLSFRQINFFNWPRGIEYQIWLVGVGWGWIENSCFVLYIYTADSLDAHPYPWLCASFRSQPEASDFVIPSREWNHRMNY